MTKLPFLQPKGPQPPRRYLGEARYAFDEASELVEQALDELIHAIQSKDPKKLVNAIMALIECVIAKESEIKDATHPQQEASGI
jgi:hypothetical protein